MSKPTNTRITTPLTRRSVLRGLGAASVAATTPRWARAQNRSDVIVIGAGLSGLGAALMLQDAGVNVQVIEGRNRIGGRIESFRHIPGNPEAGGTAFGPGYARLVEAAKKHGAPLIDITPMTPYFFQRQLIIDDEFIANADWAEHPRNPFPAAARKTMPWMYLPMLLARANPLQSSEAWRAPAHADLDVSLHEFLHRIEQSDDTIDIAYNMSPQWARSAHGVSALMALSAHYFANIQRTLTTGNPIKGYTAVGGNQSIPEAMAGSLRNEVRLNQPVIGIRSDSTGAEVHCADGTIYRAGRVICSLPCSVLRRIRIEPRFTGLQARAVDMLDSQVINQVHIVAKKPFWEEDGMSANMYTNSMCGTVVAEHKGDDPADITSLTAWIRGHRAAWMDQVDDSVGIAAVIADIERLRPAAKGLLEVAAYKSWYRDPFASGDWAVWRPGQISKFATSVAAPHARVHFCGEHTAVSNRGMEGAMESGERAAFEVLDTI